MIKAHIFNSKPDVTIIASTFPELMARVINGNFTETAKMITEIVIRVYCMLLRFTGRLKSLLIIKHEGIVTAIIRMPYVAA